MVGVYVIISQKTVDRLDKYLDAKYQSRRGFKSYTVEQAINQYLDSQTAAIEEETGNNNKKG